MTVTVIVHATGVTIGAFIGAITKALKVPKRWETGLKISEEKPRHLFLEC